MTSVSTPRSALYQTIHSQPQVVRDVLAGLAPQSLQAAEGLASAERVWLAGTGTSSHAAVVGEHLLRAAGMDAYATTLFDFVTYPRPLRQGDALIVISHRGSKRYGRPAIERAREAGIPVVGLTGHDSPMEGPGIVLQTAPQERSSAHTASYMGNLTALALIATELGARRGADVGELRAALVRLPELIEALLAREDDVRPVAALLAEAGRMTLIGAGPNAVTAREGALKVKESSYLTAEGLELETALHGALPAVTRDDLAVVIAARGPALARTGDAARALGLIGAHLMVVADERALPELPLPEGAIPFTFGAVPEPVSPLLAVVPLQLLAAFTAELRGTDPDSFRGDDPVYKRAHDSYGL
jgi:glucosamine--fructose-6-phosphate aminotransferase (isomerizing)